MNTAQPIPLAEMQSDLAATERDIERLNAIIDNLRLFISDSAGEDRSRFKAQLFTFEGLLGLAFRLRTTITERIDQANAPRS